MNQLIAKSLRKSRKPQRATNLSLRARRAVCEALEERQLMTLTITIREAGGASSATVTAVGQVIDLEVLATITSSNNIATQDALQVVNGNIVSAGIDNHAVGGNLAAALVTPFTSTGSGDGTIQDLNGDGNLDIGSTYSSVMVDGITSISPAGEFNAVADQSEGSSVGTIIDNGMALQFELATLTYTVTSLGAGGTTGINFYPQPNISDVPQGASWYEDFTPANNTNATFTGGTPFTVNDPTLIVPPTAVNDTATVIRNTPTSINELANDEFIVAANPASVTTTAPAHGTAVPLTSGEILYTPDNGYLGADSFTYTVADTGGRVSNAATVSITVVAPAPPVAGAVSTTATEGEADTINVLSSDTSPATVIPASVTVATQPAHGTAAAQATGTIIYTPAAGYLGTDTFTYTVADSDSETSSPGTVTVTVVPPVPPVAGDTTATTPEGAPVSVNVLSVDTSTSAQLSAGSIVIVTQPADGTAVPQSDGTILYSPTGGFLGSDSFTYTVADLLGTVSNAGTVTLTVTAGIPPVANPVTAPVLSGESNPINVLSSVTTDGSTLVPGTVAVVTAPAHGTTVVNTSTGAIAYTPAAGFVGSDTFSYTASDVNGETSDASTVTVYAGTVISSAKTSPHSLSFVDSAGGAETVSLNVGTAEVYFSGSGSVTTTKGKTIVTGTSLEISSIVLTGTTRASSLVIKGLVKDAVTIDGISDTAPLGSITASAGVLSGTVTLDSVGSLKVAAITNANINISGGLPARVSVTTGAISNSSIATIVPVTSLKAASWNLGSLDVPSIGSLNVTGIFNADVSLSSTGRTVSLNSAKVGSITGGTWTSPGLVGSISTGSITSGWTGTFQSTVKSLAVKTGGLASTLTTGAIGSLSVGGTVGGTLSLGAVSSLVATGSFTADLTAGTVKSLRVVGGISSAVIDVTGATLGSLTAGSLTDSTINVGNTGVALSAATTANIGTGTIGSLKLTGRTGAQFSASSIVAGKINSASVGNVATANGGNAEGLAVGSITSFTGIFSNNVLRANRGDLLNSTVLATAVTQEGVTLGDFEIVIAG